MPILATIRGALAPRPIRLYFLAALGNFAMPEGLAAATVGRTSGIGYDGPRIQLHPIMTPYRSSAGIRYEPLVIRLVLPSVDAEGLPTTGSPRQRATCFSIPYVHEALLMHVHGAGLRSEDFRGPRRELLAKNLLDAAVKKVGPGYFAALELADVDSPPLTPTSQTLSTQCR